MASMRKTTLMLSLLAAGCSADELATKADATSLPTRDAFERDEDLGLDLPDVDPAPADAAIARPRDAAPPPVDDDAAGQGGAGGGFTKPDASRSPEPDAAPAPEPDAATPDPADPDAAGPAPDDPDAFIKLEDAAVPPPDGPPGEPPPPFEPGCPPGRGPVSWRDTLPPRPAPVDPGAVLGPPSGLAEATCVGDGVVVSDPDQFFVEFASTQTHAAGQWYFEVSVDIVDGRDPSIGVFAPPATPFMMESPWGLESAGAAYEPALDDLVGVAVDLDAGQVAFFVDGVLQSTEPLMTLPGVGAWHAAAFTGSDKVVLNFGDAPFAYGVPAGYRPWASGGAANGLCEVEAPLPHDLPAVVVDCGGGPCNETGIETHAGADVQLVALSLYDSGGQAGWQWGVDANGNPVMIDLGGPVPGDVQVRIARPGRVALVLAAYEPTDWHLVVDPQTQLESVLLMGMHMQTVDGVPAGVPVGVETVCLDGAGGACDQMTGLNVPVAGIEWPMNTGGGDTQGFVEYIEARTCLPLEVFSGAYTAFGFDVR
jgi:hypothetical protein